MPIDTISDLRAHVELARRVEMSTIPPYLYASYSIKDPESEAGRLIVSVVVEEMLHLALTTNLLLALGGEPGFGRELMPIYPSDLAHHTPPLPLALRRCTPEVVRDTFMAIERPEKPGAPAEPDLFETLGQFYLALEEALRRLSATENLFAEPQADRQMADPSLYGPVAFDAADSGGLTLITDVDSAIAALEIIVDQGEGVGDDKWADPDHQELTHYWKFAQLADGETPIGDTWPVVDSPRVAEFPSPIRPVAVLFNAAYRLLFMTLREMFAPGADQSRGSGRLYGLMSGCMAPVARHLVTLSIDDTHNAGPTFEWHEFGSDPESELIALARDVGLTHPALAGIETSLRTILG